MLISKQQIMSDAWEAHRNFLRVMRREYTMVGFGAHLKTAWAKAKMFAKSAQIKSDAPAIIEHNEIFVGSNCHGGFSHFFKSDFPAKTIKRMQLLVPAHLAVKS